MESTRSELDRLEAEADYYQSAADSQRRRLEASAPDLLAAAKLRAALEDNDVHHADTRWKQLRKMERAAIAAAEGGEA